MSAIRMKCERCGRIFIAGVVGRTPWPQHVCPDGTKGAPAQTAHPDDMGEQKPGVER
jgi:hypothetical protein